MCGLVLTGLDVGTLDRERRLHWKRFHGDPPCSWCGHTAECHIEGWLERDLEPFDATVTFKVGCIWGGATDVRTRENLPACSCPGYVQLDLDPPKIAER